MDESIRELKINKMVPEVKAKLVAALRGGEYKQARSYLRTRDGYCCLGVLCDLYLKEHPEYAGGWAPYASGGTSSFSTGAEKFCSFPPNQINEWSGLVERYDDSDKARDTLRKLAAMNDDGQSFEEIADYIEKNL